MSESELNAVRETMTEREVLVLDGMLYPQDGLAPLTIEEIATIRGIKRHSAEKILSRVRGKLQAAGVKVSYPGKKRSLMPILGRTQRGSLVRVHLSLEREGLAELERLAKALNTSMGAIVNDAIVASRDRLLELAEVDG